VTKLCSKKIFEIPVPGIFTYDFPPHTGHTPVGFSNTETGCPGGGGFAVDSVFFSKIPEKFFTWQAKNLSKLLEGGWG